MPIHLTCDFCATTSDVIGHWRFEGKSDIDVVTCPACYAAHSTAWDAAHPEPPPVDWDALLRGVPCAADADDTCEVAAVDPASWQEVRYWYATCTRCFGDCEDV